MLINKEDIKKHKVFASSNKYEEVLQSIYYNKAKNTTVSTDGHRMLEIKHTELGNSGYPIGDNYQVEEIQENRIYDIETLDIFSKVKSKKTLPILDNVLLHDNGAYVNNLQTEQSSDHCILGGTYPDYEQAKPSQAPVFEISVNAQLLSEMAKALSDTNSENTVTLSFFEPSIGPDNLVTHGPLQITAKKGKKEYLALLMPMRTKFASYNGIAPKEGEYNE